MAGGIIVAAHTARAQSIEDLGKLSIEELAHVEITSVTKSPEPISRAAAAVYVITADDIIRSGATNLPEALRLAPNLEIARLNAYNWAITARGFNSPEAGNKLLVLLAPSPDFESEKLTAYQLGYRGQPTDRISLSISAYYNVYNDLRTDALINGGLPIVLMNGLAGNTCGVEAWATYSVFDWWRLKPGFDWLHKNLDLKLGATDFSELQSAGEDPAYQAQPRSEMNLSSTVEFDASLRDVGEVSRSEVPAYVECDARLAWHVTPQTALEVDSENLLDANHLEVYDPSTSPPRYIPRSVFMRVRTSF
jgi:iron complex outermembrane recepter protein